MFESIYIKFGDTHYAERRILRLRLVAAAPVAVVVTSFTFTSARAA